MGHYPLVADLRGRRVVVVGGGDVAARKVDGLLAAEADVTVVSPDLAPALATLASAARIVHVGRVYRAGDLAGADLVFVATDDRSVTAAVTAEARARRVWVNAADDPEHCDFILPAVIRRGPLLVTVTTGGASPAVARAVREELETVIGEEHRVLVEIAADVRRELGNRRAGATAERWADALAGDVRRLVRDGRPDEARRVLLERLEAAP